MVKIHVPITVRNRKRQIHRDFARDVVMQLIEPYFSTSRDLCTNNFFLQVTYRTIAPADKSDFIGNDNKTLLRSIQVIQQDDMNILYQVFI